ncbi:hypothetical protein [Streptomyces sp. NRRL F-5123]|uniref:hypothetical protein n=1 Tax=Streptomyces sp. NRRL F-5123 TaxID=1463856 RepID=UPI0004E24BE7|nr:hypothetical protein [Streptomyces sp. NRRL F-5123]
MSLTDLHTGFRDAEQQRRVRRVIHDRLADDREQQDCRFLMRFWWQLGMPYQEVSTDELRRNLSSPKLAVVEALIRAVRSSHAEIDAWIDTTERAFPVAEDRGFAAAQDAACEHPAGAP